ncbi:UDP-N-acetylmuramate dehydrogenase [uncultured Psychrobacter sp.]|uniref:UDP-N-acetylmuramate dehydrogenase n=1 Tax=uncultured Psychrobacter sp. TaxID=259303 RepID=UPI00345AC20F
MDLFYKKKIYALFPQITEYDVPLSQLSQWRIGGKAEVVVRPRSKKELIKIRQWLYLNDLKSVIIGNTTNLLFSDEGLHVVVIQIGSNFSGLKIDGVELIAESGIWIPSLARVAMQAGLSGLEHTCGIPGSLGGLIVMNGGSQRQSISSVVRYVEIVDNKGKIKRYTNKECDFSYRNSIFQNKDDVIVEVGLILDTNQDKNDIRREMLRILKSRRKKFPQKQPNCGSTFISNLDMYEDYGPPGKIIEGCGLKGLSRGDAQISKLHANFIVNTGRAQANDILYLINIIKETVYKKTGYQMIVEAKFVTSCGDIISL